MRISDWSSDVCSADLHDWKALEPLDDLRSIVHVRLAVDGRGINVYDTHLHWTEGGGAIRAEQVADALRYIAATDDGLPSVLAGAIGRASWRERGGRRGRARWWRYPQKKKKKQ